MDGLDRNVSYNEGLRLGPQSLFLTDKNKSVLVIDHVVSNNLFWQI